MPLLLVISNKNTNFADMKKQTKSFHIMMVAVQAVALMVCFVFVGQVMLQLQFNDAIGEKENVIYTKYPPETFSTFEDDDNVECVSATGILTEAKLYGKKGTCNADMLDVKHTGLKALKIDMMAGDDHFSKEDSTGVLIPASMAMMLYETTDVVGKELRWRKKGALTLPHEERIVGVYKDLPPNCELSNIAYRLGEDMDSTYALTLNYYLRIKDMKRLRTKGTIHYDAFRRLGEKRVSMESMTGSEEKQNPLSHILLVTLMFSGFVTIIATLGSLCISMAEAPSMMKKYNTLMVLGTTKGSIRWDVMMKSMIMSLAAFMIAVIGLVCIDRWKWADSWLMFRFSLDDSPLWMVGAMLGVALMMGMLAAIYPAYYSTHQPLSIVVRGRYAVSRRDKWLRRVMLCCMFALTFVVVTYVLYTWRMGIFAVCCMLLTLICVGSITIIERKYKLHSIEILRILGMTRGELLMMQVREYAKLMLIGAVIGMPVVWWLIRMWNNIQM